MASQKTLDDKQVAEQLDEVSPEVDRDEALKMAEGLRRRGLEVVEKADSEQSVDDLVATVDGLVAQLESDPNIAIGEESALRSLWRPRRDRRRSERGGGATSVGA